MECERKSVSVTVKNQRTSSAYDIFSPSPFILIHSDCKQKASLCVLYWCTASHLCTLRKCLILRKMDVCIVDFPFANDKIGYNNFFLSWDLAGDIVIKQPCVCNKTPTLLCIFPLEMWLENIKTVTILQCSYWSTNWRN